MASSAHATAVCRKTDWCSVTTVLARLFVSSGSNVNCRHLHRAREVCISGKMKNLAQALTRALVTTVFYCQWNSNTEY